MNLGVALWALGRQRREAGPAAVPDADPASGRLPPASLALAFASGFVVFVLEVSWFRSLRAALHSTTESFALILAAFLVALTLGGLLAARLQPRFPAALERLLPLAGLCVLVATPLVDSIDRWMQWFSDWVPVAFSPTIALERLGLLLVAMVLPVALLGMIFPWLLARHATTAGTGRLYAVNTAGAVSGALAAGFLLLPWIGSTRTSWLAGLAVLAVAALVDRRPRAWVAAAAAGLLGLGVATWHGEQAASRRVQGHHSDFYDEVLYVAEGPDSTVWVARNHAAGTLKLFIDGFGASSEATATNYMAWMGHLPALATPRLEQALVICFGTGQTAHAVRRHRPAALQLVDVSAAVFGAADHFKSNRGVLDDPAAAATVMDGRAFLRRRRDLRYDLVTLEPMPPNFAGSNNLYAREFYQLIKQRLTPGGAVAQWVPFHLLAPAHMMAIVSSFQEVLPYTRLWMDPVSTTGILVGGARPLGAAPGRYRAAADPPGDRGRLRPRLRRGRGPGRRRPPDHRRQPAPGLRLRPPHPGRRRGLDVGGPGQRAQSLDRAPLSARPRPTNRAYDAALESSKMIRGGISGAASGPAPPFQERMRYAHPPLNPSLRPSYTAKPCTTGC